MSSFNYNNNNNNINNNSKMMDDFGNNYYYYKTNSGSTNTHTTTTSSNSSAKNSSSAADNPKYQDVEKKKRNDNNFEYLNLNRRRSSTTTTTTTQLLVDNDADYRSAMVYRPLGSTNNRSESDHNNNRQDENSKQHRTSNNDNDDNDDDDVGGGDNGQKKSKAVEIDHEKNNEKNENDEDEDNDDDDDDDEEFQAIYKRVITKYDLSNGSTGLKSIIKTTTATKTTTTTTTSNGQRYNKQAGQKSEDHKLKTTSSSSPSSSAAAAVDDDDNNNDETNLKSVSQTLRYFYKLLKFYKLEHYMNDLIDSGYYTPISLHKLKQIELDKLNVSPYDKKKFTKLQLFIRQVMNTIKNPSSASAAAMASMAANSTRTANLTTSMSKINGHSRLANGIVNGHSTMTTTTSTSKSNHNNNNNLDNDYHDDRDHEDDDEDDEDDEDEDGNNNANLLLVEESEEKSSTNEMLNNNKLIENFYQWQSLAIKRPTSSSVHDNDPRKNINFDASSNKGRVVEQQQQQHPSSNIKNSIASSTSSSSLTNSSPSRSPSSLSIEKKTQINTLKNSSKENNAVAATSNARKSESMAESESFYRRLSSLDAYNEAEERKKSGFVSRSARDRDQQVGKPSAGRSVQSAAPMAPSAYSTGTNIYALNSARTRPTAGQPTASTNPVNRIKQRNMRASVTGNHTTASTRSNKSGAVTPRSARAKSSEPSSLTGFRRASSLSSQTHHRLSSEANANANAASAETDQLGAAVRHPNQPNFQRSSSKFFGPKLLANGNRPDEHISNVQFIENSNYNYGVPASQLLAQKTRPLRSKSANRKSAVNLGGADANPPPIATADIFVYARKRPMLASESKYTDAVMVENSEESQSSMSTSICINEMKNSVDGTPILRKNEFTFDRTFDSTFSNDEIFKSSIHPFIDSPSENRADFTCICFGQTGSGKTHTLFGNKQQDGLCVLTAQALFSNNERLVCGFYEIYNGQLYDLLNRSNKLVLREDSNGTLNVVGLVELEIKSLVQLRKTIETAQANRHIGTTSFNKASSRSHAVIQFKVPNPPASSSSNNSNNVIFRSSTGGGLNAVRSKVNSGLHGSANQARQFRVLFIDLAGSERGIDAQNNQNDNRKEGAEINQSLLALKECIRCIDQYCTHAPFRQSKLTRVLRDCFIGHCRTILIATVSPTDDCVSCSLNTLQYANRVRLMSLRNKKRCEQHKAMKRISAAAAAAKSTSTTPTPGANPIYGHQSSRQTMSRADDNNAMKRRSMSSSAHAKNMPITVSGGGGVGEATKRAQPVVRASAKPTVSSSAKTQPALASKSQSGVLPSNTYAKAGGSSNGGAKTPVQGGHIFHPSKINMSSTPIKTGFNSGMTLTKSEDMLFEHDTPIKGHRLKYMSMESRAAEAAMNKAAAAAAGMSKSQSSAFNDRFAYARHDKQTNTDDEELNDFEESRLAGKKAAAAAAAEAQQAAGENNEEKDEDDESGVESDELNKSIEVRNISSDDFVFKTIHSEMLFGKAAAAATAQVSGRPKFASMKLKSGQTLPSSQHTSGDKAKTAAEPPAFARSSDGGIYARPDLEPVTRRYRSIFTMEASSQPITRSDYLASSEMTTNGGRVQQQSEASCLIDTNGRAAQESKSFGYDGSKLAQEPGSLIDDSIARLKKRQKDLIETNKYLVQKQTSNSGVGGGGGGGYSLQSHRFSEPVKFVQAGGKANEREADEQDLNISFELADAKIAKSSNAQKQLRAYIQNLETKLIDLRNEMKEPPSKQQQQQHESSGSGFKPKSILRGEEPQLVKEAPSKYRERSLSSESNDSLKELGMGRADTGHRNIYNEFQMRRRHLEQQQLLNQARSGPQASGASSNSASNSKYGMKFSDGEQLNIYNDEGDKFSEDHEKLFFEMQKEQSEKLSRQSAKPTPPTATGDAAKIRRHSVKLLKMPVSLSPSDSSIFDNSVGSSSSDGRNPDVDALKKSLHKGNSSTDFFAKIQKSTPHLDSARVYDNHFKFMPIGPSAGESTDFTAKSALSEKEKEARLNSSLTPRNSGTQHQLVNPIPIRLSTSSSFDSTASNAKNKNDMSASARLAATNQSSKIWKTASAMPTTPSNDYTELSVGGHATWAGESHAYGEPSKYGRLAKFSPDADKSFNDSEMPSSSRQYHSKDMLVEAHQNQLSDLAETCKKEMNLLSSLKDSQMGFTDYLSQVEDMLSKKASTIRDLQQQISQLKTYGAGPVMNIVSPSPTIEQQA